MAIRSNSLWSDVTAALRDTPFRIVFDHHEVDEWGMLLNRIEQTGPDVLLLECTGKSEALEEMVNAVKRTGPAPLVIALHASPELDGVVSALRAGVFEFIYPPVEESLRKALERAQRTVHRKPPGKVFGFLSAKGGCGATTVACHAAAAIARRAVAQDKQTLLVDLDLNTGMVRFLMRAQSPYSVLDAATNLRKLDLGYWKALTTTVEPGLEVIPAPADLVSKHQLTRDQVEHVLSFARCYYDWMLVDLGRGLGLLTMSVLHEIDELFLVTAAEVPALHMTRKIVEVLTANGYNQKNIHLIANRAERRSEVPPKELESLLGLPLYASLSNEYARLLQSYSECRLLGKGGVLAGEIERLAERMTGATAPEVEPAPQQFDIINVIGSLKRTFRRASQ